MRKRFLLSCLTAAFLVSSAVYAEDISLDHVVLRGLDKITGRLNTMTVKVGEKTEFGALDIYARVCYARPPEEAPENSTYLQIVEKKPEGQLKLFSGWMFSSSPALSAMEHPVYDVWVVRCQGEQIKPPDPEPLVLENPIELKKNQPKVKILLDGQAKSVEEAPVDKTEEVLEIDLQGEGTEAFEPENAAEENTVVSVEEGSVEEEAKPQPIIVIQPKEIKDKAEDLVESAEHDVFSPELEPEESLEENQMPLLKLIPSKQINIDATEDIQEEVPAGEIEENPSDSIFPEDGILED